MKTRQDFPTEELYKEYLRTYFSAIFVSAFINEKDYGEGRYDIPARRAIKMANELIKALNE